MCNMPRGAHLTRRRALRARVSPELPPGLSLPLPLAAQRPRPPPALPLLPEAKPCPGSRPSRPLSAPHAEPTAPAPNELEGMLG